MTRLSAGILLYRQTSSGLEVLLLHPGGPLWAKKDRWTIPKGEVEPGEDELAAAKREFEEEVGIALPAADLIDLGLIRQSSAKTNHIWASNGDIDLAGFHSNDFTMEWPPKSGVIASFPECDRAEWFTIDSAKDKIFSSQQEFLGLLEQKVANI